MFMAHQVTQMRREIDEIPSAVDRLLTHGAANMKQTATGLRDCNPAFLTSVARGSSDHAATYLKYASELSLGLPVASVGPSVASIYKRSLHLAGSACIAVSQSGKSPDIVEMVRSARASGALTCTFTNDHTSPLAQLSNHCLPLYAGPEKSVAATKTFVTSMVSLIWLLAEWKNDQSLLKAIHDLPDLLEHSVQEFWPALSNAVNNPGSLFCLGRGPTLAISNEAALKFKETCQLHAESYSSAEVLHGPVSLVGQGFPVLALTAQDHAEDSLVQVADTLAQKGASVFVTSPQAKHAHILPSVRTGHPLTDPIPLIASFYAMVEATARSMKIDPDAPRHLTKITETV